MDYKHLDFDENSVFMVTGGAGFIGSNLCEAILDMGYKVICLDNLSTGKKDNISSFAMDKNFIFIEGDIRDFKTCENSCQGVDYVLHQAAWGSVPRSIEEPLLYEEINIKGTLNMMEAARRNEVKKFVYASSSAVYGDGKSLPKIEGEEGNLLSPYAVTKKTNEEYGKIYFDLYGLNTFGLRYFNVFGRRQDPNGEYAAVIPKFIKQIFNNETSTIYGDGNQSRDFTYIDNIIEANLKACMASDKYGGQVFNIAFGSQEKLIDIYKTLSNEIGKVKDPVFRTARKGDIEHSNADISKAKILLEYNPKYSFHDGITMVIDWYRNHPIKKD